MAGDDSATAVAERRERPGRTPRDTAGGPHGGAGDERGEASGGALDPPTVARAPRAGGRLARRFVVNWNAWRSSVSHRVRFSRRGRGVAGDTVDHWSRRENNGRGALDDVPIASKDARDERGAVET